MTNYINDCSCNYIGGKICGLSQCTTCGCTYDPVYDGSHNLIGWRGTGCSPAQFNKYYSKKNMEYCSCSCIRIYNESC